MLCGVCNVHYAVLCYAVWCDVLYCVSVNVLCALCRGVCSGAWGASFCYALCAWHRSAVRVAVHRRVAVSALHRSVVRGTMHHRVALYAWHRGVVRVTVHRCIAVCVHCVVGSIAVGFIVACGLVTSAASLTSMGQWAAVHVSVWCCVIVLCHASLCRIAVRCGIVMHYGIVVSSFCYHSVMRYVIIVLSLCYDYVIIML
jgi:hypothetical protein